MMTDGPPRFNPEKLDMSQLHQLDHVLGSARCRSLYGGWRRHLVVGWKYSWKEELYRRTRCRVGWHRYAPTWGRAGLSAPWEQSVECLDCGKEKDD